MSTLVDRGLRGAGPAGLYEIPGYESLRQGLQGTLEGGGPYGFVRDPPFPELWGAGAVAAGGQRLALFHVSASILKDSGGNLPLVEMLVYLGRHNGAGCVSLSSGGGSSTQVGVPYLFDAPLSVRRDDGDWQNLTGPTAQTDGRPVYLRFEIPPLPSWGTVGQWPRSGRELLVNTRVYCVVGVVPVSGDSEGGPARGWAWRYAIAMPLPDGMESDDDEGDDSAFTGDSSAVDLRQFPSGAGLYPAVVKRIGRQPSRFYPAFYKRVFDSGDQLHEGVFECRDDSLWLPWRYIDGPGWLHGAIRVGDVDVSKIGGVDMETKYPGFRARAKAMKRRELRCFALVSAPTDDRSLYSYVDEGSGSDEDVDVSLACPAFSGEDSGEDSPDEDGTFGPGCTGVFVGSLTWDAKVGVTQSSGVFGVPYLMTFI